MDHSKFYFIQKFPILFYSRRLGDGSSSRDSSDDFSEVNRSSSTAATLSQNLLVEIRQAVNEAQPKGRFRHFLLVSYSVPDAIFPNINFL